MAINLIYIADENKFGQKLLEKMGWAKGKGLGKNEQGVKNPIRVSGNSDNKGKNYAWILISTIIWYQLIIYGN